jgi:D-glutamate cyclase
MSSFMKIEKKTIDIFDRIDNLVNLDIPGRGVINLLFQFARKRVDYPLTLLASQRLNQILERGDIIFIATGWPDRPEITPDIAETDGPPGAAFLARAINRAYHAVPFIFIEENLVHSMSMVVNAAGLKVLPPSQAIKTPLYHAPINSASVLSFPIEKDMAIKKANELIKKYQPKAVITIEKGGMNEEEVIHTSRGVDSSKYMAKIDYLVQEAIKNNVTTIGIGDGGNEIGMGCIQEEIRKNIPFGDKCKCPCQTGIAPATRTDFLITAAISNWGAYGLAAGISLLKNDISIFHNGEVEKRVLQKAADAGFIDGINGYTEPGADGLPSRVHESFVEVLRELLVRGMKQL